MTIACASAALGGVISCVVIPSGPCAEDDAAASIDVAGVYRYGVGDLLDLSVPTLSGTITFEQDGNTVRVVDTTYDIGSDRALEGVAELNGNVLMITLVPKNGDTDYRADVTFNFSENGDTFCVAFSDTNDDAGGPGSFIGRRM